MNCLDCGDPASRREYIRCRSCDARFRIDQYGERFWSQVDRSDGPEDCWLWTGVRDRSEYGRMAMGKYIRAHRVAWVIANGPIPDGLHVLHHCDNPPCVRASHLWLGTDLDNQHDAASKGRSVPPPHRYGEAANGARLTEGDVRAIRRALAEGRRRRDLAQAYGVTHQNIRLIEIGHTWKHVA